MSEIDPSPLKLRSIQSSPIKAIKEMDETTPLNVAISGGGGDFTATPNMDNEDEISTTPTNQVNYILIIY